MQQLHLLLLLLLKPASVKSAHFWGTFLILTLLKKEVEMKMLHLIIEKAIFRVDHVKYCMRNRRWLMALQCLLSLQILLFFFSLPFFEAFLNIVMRILIRNHPNVMSVLTFWKFLWPTQYVSINTLHPTSPFADVAQVLLFNNNVVPHYEYIHKHMKLQGHCKYLL